MSAVGLLAPFIESLFFQCFQQIGAKFAKVAVQKTSLRSNLPPEQQWDCHYVAQEGSPARDMGCGIRQLLDMLGISERFPTDLAPTLTSLFSYRNKMFHHGFEWPIDERRRFAQRIKDEGWPVMWFTAATHGEEPWIFYLSDNFIEHVLATIDAVLDGFAIVVRDDLLSRQMPQ